MTIIEALGIFAAGSLVGFTYGRLAADMLYEKGYKLGYEVAENMYTDNRTKMQDLEPQEASQ